MIAYVWGNIIVYTHYNQCWIPIPTMTLGNLRQPKHQLLMCGCLLHCRGFWFSQRTGTILFYLPILFNYSWFWGSLGFNLAPSGALVSLEMKSHQTHSVGLFHSGEHLWKPVVLRNTEGFDIWDPDSYVLGSQTYHSPDQVNSIHVWKKNHSNKASHPYEQFP